MFRYQLKIALKSLRRNPVLSGLLVAAIALGITISTTFLTAYHVLSGDPIPHKSDVLHYVQLDAWSPEESWDDEKVDEPPDQLTYRDMRAAMASGIPTYKTGMYKVFLTVHPDPVHAAADAERPFRSLTRLCFGDFFPMFDTPFLYGGGWGPQADENTEAVVVLGRELNERLFGGEDSVGRSLRIEDRSFTVVGVLDHWKPVPKFYDLTNGAFEEIEEMFLPFNLGIELEIRTAGNTNGWKFEPMNTFADRLEAETTWLQMWVQLDTPEQHDAYLAYLDAYALEQKKLGRFGRPLNNRLRPVMEWMTAAEATPKDSTTMLIIALLFLAVCSINMVGILLGKFLARAPEVGVRRALGASKRSIFVQHIIECELIGLIGGVVGMVLSIWTLRIVLGWVSLSQVEARLDLPMIAAAIALSLTAGLVAGLYPAWRICRIAPAHHLKMQ